MLLSPLVILIWVATLLSLRSARKRQGRLGRVPMPLEVEMDLKRVALSKALLFGKKTVLRPGGWVGSLWACDD